MDRDSIASNDGETGLDEGGTDESLPPEVAEARRRQGIDWPPKKTGTGFFYRNGDEIPPTHPDHGPMHLIPRQQDGSFAAYYYCSKDELACMADPAPPPRRHRRDGFSLERQQQFVEKLRDTASITDAARLTGISRSTVYNLLNSADGDPFRAAVEEALKGTDVLLEATALDRAVNGQEEIVYFQGRRVGVRWKYDNKLLMALLRARNPLKYAPLSEIEGWLRHRGVAAPPDVEGELDRLAAAEAEWGRTLPGEGGTAPALAGPGDAAPAQSAIEGQRPAALSAASTAANDPAIVSTLSTLPGENSAVVSTSSTSSAPGDPAIASTSSTSDAAGAPASTSAAGEPIPFRPPPIPRIRLA
ncbi:MAG TPA: hypothetical protein VK614_14665 [Allosphingosinicella sp.]|nr:hypothetical protein [Allosphingosinicella sp.]